MPDDKTQAVDWQNDPDFHALPLAEKHKVLLQVDPDYKGLPGKEQAKALDSIHYGDLGKISGEGISLKGAGTGAWNAVKGMAPQAPKAPILSKEFWLGKPDQWSIDPSKGGVAQMGTEASAEYQRARAAGTNPIAAGYSAAISGTGPLAGVSDIEQQKLAEQGEGGQIIGQSAVPAAAALAGPAMGRALKGALPEGAAAPTGGGFSPEVAGAVGRKLGHATGIPGAGWVGEKIFRGFGKSGMPAPPEPTPFPGATSTAAPIGTAELPAVPKGQPTPFPRVRTSTEIRAAAAEAKSTAKAAAKAQEKAQAATQKAAEKAAKVEPSPFSGATSTAAPIGSAELPPVPQGQPAPFPAVTRKGGMAPPPSPETGGPLDVGSPQDLVRRPKQLVIPGEEPSAADLKRAGDATQWTDAKLRQLAKFGDKIAENELRRRAKLGLL